LGVERSDFGGDTAGLGGRGSIAPL
jgi:hypothetical protein